VFFSFNLAFLGFFQVIWVIGVSMIVLAGLIHLPRWVSAAVGVVMVAGHNLLDPIQVATDANGVAVGWGKSLWAVLHQPAPIQPFGPNLPFLLVLYPLIPWIGVMALGFVFAEEYVKHRSDRPAWLFRVGLTLTLAFLAIRAINIYGDPKPWAPQPSPVFTALSFLNTSKYPPSLEYLLMTLGPALMGLAWLEIRVSRASPGPFLRRALLRFGKVPLFFYLLQWPVAHGLAVLISLAAGKPVAHYFASPPDFFAGVSPDFGFSLGVVYLVWLAAIALLYPLCVWWVGVKARRQEWWVRYL